MIFVLIGIIHHFGDICVKLYDVKSYIDVTDILVFERKRLHLSPTPVRIIRSAFTPLPSNVKHVLSNRLSNTILLNFSSIRSKYGLVKILAITNTEDEELFNLTSDHEEAGSRMFVYAHYMGKHYNHITRLIIKSPDTDIAIIAYHSLLRYGFTLGQLTIYILEKKKISVGFCIIYQPWVQILFKANVSQLILFNFPIFKFHALSFDRKRFSLQAIYEGLINLLISLQLLKMICFAISNVYEHLYISSKTRLLVDFCKKSRQYTHETPGDFRIADAHFSYDK